MSDRIADSPLLETKDLAVLLKKTPHAVRQMRARGIGPRGFRSGRKTLYREAEVRRWLAAQEAGDRLGQRAAA